MNRPPDYSWVGRYGECRYSLEVLSRDAGAITGELVVRHVGTEEIEGRLYQKYTSASSGLPMPQTANHYRKAPDGIYTIERDASLPLPEQKVIPLPLRVGDTWSSVHSTAGRQECRAEAEETAELVDRRYRRSIRVTCDVGDGDTWTTYYAPGFGSVKSVADMKSKGITFSASLIKCK